MSADDLAIAREFLGAVAAAACTGEQDAMYQLLAPDVEWLTPIRDLHGLDEVRTRVDWPRPHAALEIEFAEPTLTDLGDGRVVSEMHETYRMKATGEYAYARDRRFDLTILERRIARYEMRIVG